MTHAQEQFPVTDYGRTRANHLCAIFEILAEELARRDMAFEPITRENYDELAERIEDYIEEFEENGVEHITVDK